MLSGVGERARLVKILLSKQEDLSYSSLLQEERKGGRKEGREERRKKESKKERKKERRHPARWLPGKVLSTNLPI